MTSGASAAPPTNDDFANAEVISGPSGSANGTNVEATVEPGEPAHHGPGPFHSVWFRWAAPEENSFVEFNTCGSTIDTVLAAYTGSPVTALDGIASDDDGCGDRTSRIRFSTTSGTTYKIAVDGFNAATTGTFELNWRLIPAPPNDDFDDAEVLTGADGSVKGSNVLATSEPDEPFFYEPAGHSVWYRWTAPLTGTAFFDLCESDFDTTLAVFTGDALDDLEFVAFNDDACENLGSFVQVPTTGGTEYRILVDSFDSSQSGLFVLNWHATDYRIDASIKPAAGTNYVGDDIYGSGGEGFYEEEGQVLFASGKPGSTQKFDLRLQNEGDQTDEYYVFGDCFGRRGFNVRYLDGKTDVTDAVNRGGYSTPELENGDEHILRVKVKIASNAQGRLSCFFYGVSDGSFVDDQVILELRAKAS